MRGSRPIAAGWLPCPSMPIAESPKFEPAARAGSLSSDPRSHTSRRPDSRQSAYVTDHDLPRPRLRLTERPIRDRYLIRVDCSPDQRTA